MHEFSLASELMDQLLRIAADRKVVRFQEVVLRCGVLQQVVPEAFAQAFEALSQDTPVAGAELKMVSEALAARCRNCGEQYDAAIDDYSCPKCGEADVEIVAGRDLILQSVTAETLDGEAPGPAAAEASSS